MSESLEWVTFIVILFVFILLIILIIAMYKTMGQLRQTEAVIDATSTKLTSTADTVNASATHFNSFLQKAEPVFDYAENFICTSITPKPTFCK